MVTALTAIPLRPGAPVGGADREHGRSHDAGRSRAPAVQHRTEQPDSTQVDEVVTAPLDRAERRAVSAFLGAGLVTTTTANAARAVLEPAEAGSHHRHRRAV